VTMRKLVLPLVPLLAVTASAQEMVGPPGEREAARLAALESSVALKLEVVFTRYQGEKRINRLPFTLLLNSDNSYAGLKMGLMVPPRYEKEDMHGNVVFKDVLTRARCRAQALSGERFALNSTAWSSCSRASSKMTSAASVKSPTYPNSRPSDDRPSKGPRTEDEPPRSGRPPGCHPERERCTAEHRAREPEGAPRCGCAL